MPTRKIADIPTPCPPAEQRRVCMHPEHTPPSMMVYKPGVYEHTCPGCLRRVTVTVPLVWGLARRWEASGELVLVYGCRKARLQQTL